MMQWAGRSVGLIVLALVVGVFAAPSAFSAAPPRIVGTLKVGGVASAKFAGRVSAYRWDMCASVSGLKCLRRVKIGNTKTIVVPASAAGRPLMVSVKVKKRWVKSAWSGIVAAAKPAAASTPAPTPAAATTATGTAPAGNTLTGTVGPGFTISLQKDGADVTALPAGTYSFIVSDQSAAHNFALVSPDGTPTELTTVLETGSKTVTIDLTAGTWKFKCEAHSSSMNGSFTVN